MADALNIALIGCGTVGSGVAKLLHEQRTRLEGRAGRPLALRRIIVRDPAKERGVALPRELFSTDIRTVLDDPKIDVAVELVGGVDFARRAVIDLLAAGKHVVTANKALLARYGKEVFEKARQCGRAIAFEASVGGGIPIIAALTQGLAANQIVALLGILNGTCNFILTSMTELGMNYATALAEAQRLGYAESDPTLDVDGTDAAHKLAILSQIAFGFSAPVDKIARRGIAGLNEMDILYGGELGYTIKLLAEAWLHEHQLAMHVSPVLLREQTPLAQVRGAYNAIQVVGDAVGDTLYYGQGAGQMPTASAVVADLIDLAVGRGQRTFETLRLWSGHDSGVTLRPAESVRSRFYLRVMVDDRPGVLADVAGTLARHQVSIASVSQPEAPEDHREESAPLVILTHTIAYGAFQAAFEEINRLGCVHPPGAYYTVAD